MKKITLFTALFVLSNLAFAGDEPTSKVRTAFEKTFRQSAGVRWYGQANGYGAFFQNDGITHRINYDADGNIVSAIRYYGEQHLPFGLAAEIQKRFGSRTVHGVTEVTANNETVYEIYLQDEKTLLTVRADHYGHLEEAARYLRGDAGAAN